MRRTTLGFAVLLLAFGAAESLAAQSAWDRLKQAAKQAEQRKNQTQSATHQGEGIGATDQAFHPSAETGTPELTASLAANAGFIDVTGIKLGMRVKDAVMALKSHSSLLKVTPNTYVHELIPNQTLVPGVDAAVPLVKDQIFEQYHIAFTMQPSDGYVMAVTHVVHYPPGQQPAYSSAIEGMRAKYGKENYVPRAAATGPSFFWVFDQQGKPVQGPDVQRIVEKCTNVFLTEDWERAVDAVTLGYNEQKMSMGPLRCSSYATVGVYFQGSLIPGQTNYLLDNLTVVASNGGLYRSAVEATHAQYLAAQRKKDNNTMNKAQKQGVQY